jgi:superfamily II DNA or RNA helicase
LFINGEVDIDSREEIREIMEQNDNCLCIANTKCVGTGMNIKKIDNIVFAFTTGLAIVKIIQAIGRGLRLYDGKDHVKIIDVYHDFKYSKSHFAERCDLYKKNYGDDVPIRPITFNI